MGGISKPIHRLMLTSKAYQLSSESGDSTGPDRDPANRYLWRMTRKRRDAEALRDAILAVSGQLNRKAGGPGVLVELEPEVRSLIFTEQETVELWPVNEDPSERLSPLDLRLPETERALPDVRCVRRTGCAHALSRPGGQHACSAGVGPVQQRLRPGVRQGFRPAASAVLRRPIRPALPEAFLRCYAREPSRQEMREALEFISSTSGSELERWSDFALALHQQQ